MEGDVTPSLQRLTAAIDTALCELRTRLGGLDARYATGRQLQSVVASGDLDRLYGLVPHYAAVLRLVGAPADTPALFAHAVRTRCGDRLDVLEELMAAETRLDAWLADADCNMRMGPVESSAACEVGDTLGAVDLADTLRVASSGSGNTGGTTPLADLASAAPPQSHWLLTFVRHFG